MDAIDAVAIVPARDEERTIAAVLTQLRRLPFKEIVVVLNGSQDRTGMIARRQGCRVVETGRVLGHDVGRALGAVSVLADVYFFVDADIVCEAEEYLPFLLAAVEGVDVALNDLLPILTPMHRVHSVNVAKAFLNYALGVPELGVCSMTTVPHALTRKAVEIITPARLAIPPLAHAVAVLSEDIAVKPVASVDVVHRNRVHRLDSPDRSPKVLEKLIVGDHIEALHYVIQVLGRRGPWRDQVRLREVLRDMDEISWIT